MLNNISSQNIYPKQYQLKNNLKTNTNFTNFENSQDKISFKGGNITKIANNKSVIPIFSILGGVLTSLAIKFGLKEKTESIDDKITRYAEKYPKLADILNQTYEIDGYSTQEKSVYDDYAKLAIYETYEKDPEKALILLKKLERNYNNEEYTDEVLNAVINYEITGNSNLTQEYNKKLLLKKYPELEEIKYICKDLSADNLKNCIQYMTDEKNIEALQEYLEKNNDGKFCIDKENRSSRDIYRETLNNKEAMNLMLDIAKKYPDMSKETFNLITTLTAIEKVEDISSNIDKIVDFYNKSIYQDMTKNKVFHYADNLLKYAKYYNKSNECCNLTLRLLDSRKFTYNHKDETIDSLFDKLEKTQKIFNSAFLEKDNKRLPFNDLFDKANDLNTDINLNLVNKLLKFADSINEESEKHYKRMVNDGRYETLEKMQDLLPLYEKYPNTVITSDMVAKFNDPNRRALNLY